MVRTHRVRSLLRGVLASSILAALVSAGCDEQLPSIASPDESIAAVDDAAVPVDDASSSSAPDAGLDAERTTLRLLFIGNSYTYVNDVPGILARIAESAGDGPRIATDEVVQGGATLSSLLSDGVASARIADGGFTHVVLQQQSQLGAGGLRGLQDPAAQAFGAMIVDAGATPTWFITWARAAGDGIYFNTFKDPAKMQDYLTRGYIAEARKFPGSVLACVGEAFRRSLHDHPEIALHQTDMSHATLAGSYLAAATFYVALTGRAVPAAAEVPDGLAAGEAALLRETAGIGSSCADVKLEAEVHFKNMYGATIFKPYEIGTLVTPTFDFGVAGTKVAATFFVVNDGELTADAAWSLSGRFAWTGGAFPGIAADAGNASIPPCASTLPPSSQCSISITYDPNAPVPNAPIMPNIPVHPFDAGPDAAGGAVTLALTHAYDDAITVPLGAESTAPGRALLTLGTIPMWPIEVGHLLDLGRCSPVVNVVVSNRGDAPTTSLIAKPLDAPLMWGALGEGFPGGSGTGTPCQSGLPADDPTVTLPYCGAVLEPGASCVAGIAMNVAQATTGIAAATVVISYSDALGPAQDLTSTLYLLPAPPRDAGSDAASD